MSEIAKKIVTEGSIGASSLSGYRKIKEDEVLHERQDMVLFRFSGRNCDLAKANANELKQNSLVEKLNEQIEPEDLKCQLLSTEKEIHGAEKRRNALENEGTGLLEKLKAAEKKL